MKRVVLHLDCVISPSEKRSETLSLNANCWQRSGADRDNVYLSATRQLRERQVISKEKPSYEDFVAGRNDDDTRNVRNWNGAKR